MRAYTILRKPSMRPRRSPLAASHAPLVQTAAVRQILHGPRLQAKLTVGPPDDAHEREADRVADAVMRMPEPEGRVQRVCAECEEEMQRQPAREDEEEEKKLQAKAAPGQVPEVTPNLESRIAALRGSGQPLPSSERAFFEPRFWRGFGDVRIHSGSAPEEIAHALHAKAFTAGNHIVFGNGAKHRSSRAP